MKDKHGETDKDGWTRWTWGYEKEPCVPVEELEKAIEKAQDYVEKNQGISYYERMVGIEVVKRELGLSSTKGEGFEKNKKVVDEAEKHVLDFVSDNVSLLNVKAVFNTLRVQLGLSSKEEKVFSRQRVRKGDCPRKFEVVEGK